LIDSWIEYCLKDITSIITKGTTPSTYGFKFQKNGINYIKSQCLDYNGTIDEDSFDFISLDAHDKLKRSQLKSNDLLISMAGANLGMIGTVKSKHCPANTNQAVGIIRISSPKISVKFTELCLRNPSTVKYIHAQSGQSAQPNINLTEIGNLKFLFPPLPEQKAIASILSTIDDKIELNLQMNKTLEDMAMTLYKHWFVDFGPFKDGKFVESELGMIPEGWEVESVYNVAKYINGAAFKASDFTQEGLFVIKIAELKNGISDNTKKSQKEIKKDLYINDGSVLFSWSASLDVFLWDKGEALLNQHIFNVIPNGKMPIEILFFMLKNIIQEFQRIAASRATTMGHIKISHLKETKLAIPKNFNSIGATQFKNLFDSILLNKTINQTLIELRNTLLPKLISGKVRLKEFEKQVSEAL